MTVWIGLGLAAIGFVFFINGIERSGSHKPEKTRQLGAIVIIMGIIVMLLGLIVYISP